MGIGSSRLQIVMNTADTNERLVLISGGLTISAGVNRFDAPMRVRSDLAEGLKVVVLLSGRLKIRVGEGGEQNVSGPAALVIRSTNQTPRDQVFTPDIPLRYALVQMNETVYGARLSQALDDLSRASSDELGKESSILLCCPASQTLRALANQIMACPVVGPERDLFLCGKALQMASLAISTCIAHTNTHDTLALSSRDVANIRKAKDILIESMRNPPSLDVLAQKAGLNVRKLNSGFRALYGTTVFAFLQEHRLEVAYRLIASGEVSVSEAAHYVGYGPAHFATVFRKRFGISPGQLR